MHCNNVTTTVKQPTHHDVYHEKKTAQVVLLFSGNIAPKIQHGPIIRAYSSTITGMLKGAGTTGGKVVSIRASDALPVRPTDTSSRSSMAGHAFLLCEFIHECQYFVCLSVCLSGFPYVKCIASEHHTGHCAQTDGHTCRIGGKTTPRRFPGRTAAASNEFKLCFTLSYDLSGRDASNPSKGYAVVSPTSTPYMPSPVPGGDADRAGCGESHVYVLYMCVYVCVCVCI